MQQPVSEEEARNRWMVISASRLAGAAMALVGLLILSEVIPVDPMWVGYVILGAGLVDFFLVPVLLARKWRSPDE
jgi:hypothetical protein